MVCKELICTPYASLWLKFLRCAYHANVMKTLEMVSRSTVFKMVGIIFLI